MLTPVAPLPPQPSVSRDIWRFLLPFIESNVVALAAHYGFHVSNRLTVAIAAALGTVIGVLVRALEARWPRIGIVLGAPGAPAFPASVKDEMLAYASALQLQVAQLQTQLTESTKPSPVTAVTPPPAP